MQQETKKKRKAKTKHHHHFLVLCLVLVSFVSLPSFSFLLFCSLLPCARHLSSDHLLIHVLYLLCVDTGVVFGPLSSLILPPWTTFCFSRSFFSSFVSLLSFSALLLCTTSQLWSSADLSLLFTLRGHRRGIWSIEFSPAQPILASASGDKKIKIWNIKDGTCLRVSRAEQRRRRREEERQLIKYCRMLRKEET